MAVSRMVKNLEAGLIAVFTPQLSPKLWLVCYSSITHITGYEFCKCH
jgi:hypothetical protein